MFIEIFKINKQSVEIIRLKKKRIKIEFKKWNKIFFSNNQ